MGRRKEITYDDVINFTNKSFCMNLPAYRAMLDNYKLLSFVHSNTGHGGEVVGFIKKQRWDSCLYKSAK